jgi:hypothetical protein
MEKENEDYWVYHPLEEKCWEYVALQDPFNEAVEAFVDDAQKKDNFEYTEILEFLKYKLDQKIHYAKEQVKWGEFFEENEENILLV